MTPRLRAAATEVLFSRPTGVAAFLDAVEKETVSRADVEPARLELLRHYPDEAVRRRAARVLTVGMARREDVVAEYRKALDLKGDRNRGKAVFEARCGSCHLVDGVGQNVGADLRAVRDRGLDAILLNILDPNREVLPPYLSYVISTTTGRVVTGMISAETANSLTVRRPDGSEETIPRAEIEELRSTGLSFMPEGLEKTIDVPAMADLLAFLNSAK
jgi:putative heme-binding domain-containing protein